MRNSLVNRIGIAVVKDIVSGLQGKESVDALVDLIHDTDEKVAWNAAWVMTHFSNTQISYLQGRRDELMDLILNTERVPLRRLLLNVVERLPMEAQDIRTDYLDFCLNHMVSLAEPPGVQSLCMKEAYRQCVFFDELLQEFKMMLKTMDVSFYSIAVTGLRKRLLKTIEDVK